jgi:hypothetical protein
MFAVPGRRPQREVESGSFSPGSGRMGRLGFFVSPSFLFDCFSSFIFPAELNWG